MPTFQILDSKGKVVNTIVADTEFVQAQYPGKWKLVPDTPQPDPVPAQRHISVGAFFDRFGEFKYPILSSTDAGVKALIQDCSVRSYIDLDNPALPAGLEMLILAGFAVDANEVINAPIQSHELP